MAFEVMVIVRFSANLTICWQSEWSKHSGGYTQRDSRGCDDILPAWQYLPVCDPSCSMHVARSSASSSVVHFCSHVVKVWRPNFERDDSQPLRSCRAFQNALRGPIKFDSFLDCTFPTASWIAFGMLLGFWITARHSLCCLCCIAGCGNHRSRVYLKHSKSSDQLALKCAGGDQEGAAGQALQESGAADHEDDEPHQRGAAEALFLHLHGEG